eukprot:gnl/TRDRNA2_/TRDRNA2_187370_c0_seq1.p2 gnl/TRDRNA2_/TRDRNA2_187370_c0~~gnl/TRDRNA2_/TRDRNA2_187370_c0_seq1.p2  ORF type:complete len:178 (-),score=48.04 gnl/TRDRNA2_/TRDRNA2_187370_c0_seq1:19-552(-)
MWHVSAAGLLLVLAAARADAEETAAAGKASSGLKVAGSMADIMSGTRGGASYKSLADACGSAVRAASELFRSAGGPPQALGAEADDAIDWRKKRKKRELSMASAMGGPQLSPEVRHAMTLAMAAILLMIPVRLALDPKLRDNLRRSFTEEEPEATAVAAQATSAAATEATSETKKVM